MLIGWCAGLRGTTTRHGHSPCLHCDCGEFWHASSLTGRTHWNQDGFVVTARPDGVCENCRRPLTRSAARIAAACAYVRLRGDYPSFAIDVHHDGTEVEVTRMLARMLRPRVRQIRHRRGR